jgi:Sec-independent protein secretion pathway component TatC
MKSAVLSVKLEARIFPYILFIFQILGTYSLGVFIVFTALLLRNLDFMNFIYIRKNRKIFFFLCIVVAALVAPPDVYSQGTITLLLWLSVEFLIFIDCYMQALNSQPVSN